ncbi:MAG: hypothetical protein ACREBZ_07250 [Thermoplasmata archaeon]
MVRLASLPDALDSFALINTSSVPATDSHQALGDVWFEDGVYSPAIAAEQVEEGCITASCPYSMPLQWSAPSLIGQLGGTVSADDIAVMGSTMVVAASDATSTNLYANPVPGGGWTQYGVSIPGEVVSLSAAAGEVLVVTQTDRALFASTLNSTGNPESTVSLDAFSSPMSTPLGVSSAVLVNGNEVVAFSSPTTGSITVKFSSSDGEGFTTAHSAATARIRGMAGQDSAGRVSSSTGLQPGQLTLAITGSGVVLLYTTLVGGGIALAATLSTDDGVTWTHPSSTGPVPGVIDNLSVADSPSGLLYATWSDATNHTGQIEMEVLSSTGVPLNSPVALRDSLAGPTGIASVAVNQLQQPLVAWAADSEGGRGSIEITGGFLPASQMLSLTGDVATQTLLSTAFSGGAADTQTSYNAEVNDAATSLTANLTAAGLCSAQIASVTSLYRNLTSVPLALIPDVGGGCGSDLGSDGSGSPVAIGEGSQAPSVYIAVYADWFLESIGLEPSASPLTEGDGGGPTAPGLTGESAERAVTFGNESIGYGTEVASVTPIPLSPTSFELQLGESTPAWTVGTGPGGQCTIAPIESGTALGEVRDTANSTNVSVTVDGAPMGVFGGGSAAPSVVIGNLVPSSAHEWSVNLSVDYSQPGTSGCAAEGEAIGPSDAPNVTLSGTVNLDLALIGNLSAVDSELIQSVMDTDQFRVPVHTTLPAEATATLTDLTSGETSIVSTSSYSYTTNLDFDLLPATGDSYSLGLNATSESGTWVSSESPSIALDSASGLEALAGVASAAAVGTTPSTTSDSVGGTITMTMTPSGIDSGVVPLVGGNHCSPPRGQPNYCEGTVLFVSTGLPSGSTWSVEIGGHPYQSTSGTITAAATVGVETYTITPPAGYAASPSSGAVDVSPQETVTVSVTISQASYSVKFTESGLPGGQSWSVTLAGLQLRSSASTISFSEYNGAYSYTVGAPSGDIVSPTSGTATVSGATVVVSVSITPMYSVTFNQSGLPSSLSWSVTLGGQNFGEYPTSQSIGFTEPAGTYDYTLSDSGGYSACPSTGVIVVAASSVWWNVVFMSSCSSISGLELYGLPGATEANLTWTGPAGLTSVSYSPTAGGSTAFYTLAETPAPGTTGTYVALLTGLIPGQEYGGEVSIELTLGSSTETLNATGPDFYTPAIVPVELTSLSYDSITESGGGAVATVSLPSSLDGFSFVSGWLQYTPASGSTTTESIAPEQFDVEGQWANEVNFTPILLNTDYYVALELNFTNATSSASVEGGSSFVYEKDTSGNGLTDIEKTNGWVVPLPYPDVAAGSCPEWNGGSCALSGDALVTANPNLYSTNGLTSDFLEKELDLDPNTIDTAGSHMLDTWNLTFDLGPATSATLPTSDFEYWYENQTYIFNESCPTPSTASCSWLAPMASNYTSTMDSSSWDATAVWASSPAGSSPLAQLESLISNDNVGWLRAMTGKWFNPLTGVWDRTITVWGKLSWGANPLVSSTPGDGIVDGSRINPLEVEDLQINIADSDGVAGLNFGTCDYIPSGSTFALRVWVNTTGATPQIELPGNYSQEAAVGSGNQCGYIGGNNPLIWTLPVDNQVQYQSVQFQLVLDTYALLPVHLNGTQVTADTTVDMLNARPLTGPLGGASYLWDGTGSSSPYGAEGNLALSIIPVPASGKDPVFLYLPSDNSTVSSLAGGMQRYTGSQNFVMIVANASTAPLSLSWMVEPWGGLYTLKLAEGLNTFLVPTTVFLNSSMGEALFSDSVLPDSGSTVPSLLTVDTGGPAVNESSPQLAGNALDLACYWQNRAVDNFSGAPNLCSTHPSDAGTLASSSMHVNVLNATPSSCASLCGSSPQDTQLQNAAAELPAITSILTLNMTFSYDAYALLAGLLDNASGGINGTFEPLSTANLLSLGLNSAVLSALPNAILPNTPIFGPPSATQGTGCSGWGCAVEFFNSVAGAIVNGAETVGTIAWDTTIAIATYLDDIVVAAAHLLDEYLIAPALGALESVGQAVYSALNYFVTLVIQLVEAALNAALQPLLSALSAYATPLASDVGEMSNDFVQNHTVKSSELAQFWSDLGGSVFVFSLSLAATVTVVLAIVTGLSLGLGFLVGILLGLIVTSSLRAQASASTFSPQSETSGAPSGPAAPLVSAFAELNRTYPQVNESPSAQSDLAVTGTALGWLATGVGFSIGFKLSVLAFASEAPIVRSLVGFAIAVTSLVLALYALSHPGLATSVLSLGLGVTALGFSLWAAYTDPPPVRYLDLIGVGCSVGSVLTSAYQISQDV